MRKLHLPVSYAFGMQETAINFSRPGKKSLLKLQGEMRNCTNFSCEDPTVGEGAFSFEKFTEFQKIFPKATAFKSLPSYGFPSTKHSICRSKDTATVAKDES